MKKLLSIALIMLCFVATAFAYTAERLPVYKNGGKDGLMHDLYGNLTLPETDNPREGRIIVKFQITDTGVINQSSITVIRNWQLPVAFEGAVIEAVRKLGGFSPGLIEDKAVNVWFTVGVTIPVPEKYKGK